MAAVNTFSPPLTASTSKTTTTVVASRTALNRPTEADILNRLHVLPDSALFSPAETAIYLNVGRDLLRAWRWRECGPAYVGRGHLVRYRKGEIDRFLREGEQPAAV